MDIFNRLGRRVDNDFILVGAVLDTPTDNDRFTAMKQLLDLGVEKYKNPKYVVKSSDFNIASAGAVCVLPPHNPVMYDGIQPEILFAQNGNIQYAPASVTKMVTMVTGIPYIDSLAERVTIQESDIQPGSGGEFYAGDVLTMQNLIYCTMFASSNTCATAFARHIGAKLLGDTSKLAADCLAAFYAEMNRKASAIGCTNSIFTSADGNTDTTLTTATDLVKIAVHACSIYNLANIWNKKAYTAKIEGANARERELTYIVTTKATVADYYYVLGGKSGSGCMDGSTNWFRGLAMIAKPKETK